MLTGNLVTLKVPLYVGGKATRMAGVLMGGVKVVGDSVNPFPFPVLMFAVSFSHRAWACARFLVRAILD